MWICKNKGPTCKVHLYFFIELTPVSCLPAAKRALKLSSGNWSWNGKSVTIRQHKNNEKNTQNINGKVNEIKLDIKWNIGVLWISRRWQRLAPVLFVRPNIATAQRVMRFATAISRYYAGAHLRDKKDTVIIFYQTWNTRQDKSSVDPPSALVPWV